MRAASLGDRWRWFRRPPRQAPGRRFSTGLKAGAPRRLQVAFSDGHERFLADGRPRGRGTVPVLRRGDGRSRRDLVGDRGAVGPGGRGGAAPEPQLLRLAGVQRRPARPGSAAGPAMDPDPRALRSGRRSVGALCGHGPPSLSGPAAKSLAPTGRVHVHPHLRAVELRQPFRRTYGDRSGWRSCRGEPERLLPGGDRTGGRLGASERAAIRRRGRRPAGEECGMVGNRPMVGVGGRVGGSGRFRPLGDRRSDGPSGPSPSGAAAPVGRAGP